MGFITGSPRRRGVGSIIGAAFILLILMTGFSYYTLQFSETRKYSAVLQEMQEVDLRRNSESVDILSVSLTSLNKLNVTVTNTGSYQTHILWIGVHEVTGNTHDYYELELFIEPGEVLTDIGSEDITILEGEELLIQLVTEYGNIFTCGYPFDSGGSGEGETGQSTVTIVGMGLPYNPSDYTLLGFTQNVSGSILEIESEDDSYFSFSSYNSGNGTDLNDFVDNNLSDVDGSGDMGSHSNFTAQQAAPDSNLDVLGEEYIDPGSTNTTLIFESFEGSWPPLGWSETPWNNRWNGENDQAYDGSYSADFDGQNTWGSGNIETMDLDCSNANAIYVEFWYRDEGCESGEFSLEYYDGSSWNPISDLGATSMEDQWLLYEEKITDVQYFKSNFRIRWVASGIDNNEHAYFDLVTVKMESGGGSYQLDLEVQWTGVDFTQTNEQLAIYLDGNSGNTFSLDGTGGYMIIGDGTPDWGGVSGTISFWMKCNTVADRIWGQDTDMELRFSGSNLILDWGSTNTLVSGTSFVDNKWYFIAVAWNEISNELFLYVGDEDNTPVLDASDVTWFDSVSTLGVTENNFMAARGGMDPVEGHGDELRYWNVDRDLVDIQTDYKTELSGSESSLRSYFKLNGDFNDIGPDDNDGSGSGSYSFSPDVPFGGSESLRVDVWDGGAWQNLFLGLTGGWNNISVSSYLDTATFTIRYKDSEEVGDSSPNAWNIDAALLHLWSDSSQQTSEVEFSGVSNNEAWTALTWMVDSSWNTSLVPVNIQLYDFNTSSYSLGGDGYISYVSDAIPNTDEQVNQTITSDPTRFRNSTGHWRMRIAGERSAVSQFQMNVDWILFKPRYESSGSSIEYDTWQEYRIRARTGDGVLIPYAYTSIYANGTSLMLRDAITKLALSNPDWFYLNENGEYYVEVKSSKPFQEQFFIKAVVGSVIGEKTIVQEAP